VAADFHFTSRFLNNSVFILDCLRSNESQTGLKLYEELRDIRDYDKVDVYIEHIRVLDAGALRQALDRIHALALEGFKPIIHFECHGDEEVGLEIGDVADLTSWDALEPLLRRINVACGCNLGVVMGVCWGMYAITPIRIHRPVPFYFLVGSQTQLTAGTLREEMPAFYRTLLQNGSLEAAMKCVPSCQPFHAEKLLAVGFAKYLKRGCIGKGRSERVERLFTEIYQSSGGNLNRAQRRNVRESFRKQSRAEAQESAFSRYARTFLHGKPCSFTFADLLSWVRS
jgi:hypothetical protein